MQGITASPDPSQARVTPDSGLAPNRNHAWQRMTRTVAHYERIEQIGEGTYGQVYRARCLDTGRIVALKKTRIMSSKGYTYGMPLQLIREIKILKQLQHPNLLQLIEVVTSKGVEHLDHDDPPTTGESARASKKSRGKSDEEMNDDAGTVAREKYKGNLFLVLEYVSHDLTGLLDVAYQFSEVQIKCVFQQLLRALAFMHQHKMVHRDIKSSNILIDSKFRLKLADFGLARSLEPPLLDQMEPNGAGSTMQDISYKVITLWYRPPEILLGAVHYDCKVDLWSAGCILAELLGNKPLMPGKSELDQLSMIAEVVGTPSQDTWDHLMSLKKTPRMLEDLGNISSKANELKSGEQQPSKLRDKFRRRKPSDAAYNILDKLLEWDPRKRITAESALQNRFFWTQPVPPENPEELGRIEVAEDGHFHEFQTKQKRREAKAIAEEERDEALRKGMTKSEAEAVYDEKYQGIMKQVAKEGIVDIKEKERIERERSSERKSERSPDRKSERRRHRDPSHDSDSRHRRRKKHRKERGGDEDDEYESRRTSRRRSSEDRRESKDGKERRSRHDPEYDASFSPPHYDERDRHHRDRSRESKKSKKKGSKKERSHKSRDRDERRRRHREDDIYPHEPEHGYPRSDRVRSPPRTASEGRHSRGVPPVDDRYGPPVKDRYGPPLGDRYGPSIDDRYIPPVNDRYGPPVDDRYGPPVDDRYGPPIDGPSREPNREPHLRDVPIDRRPLPSDGHHYGPGGRNRAPMSPPRDHGRRSNSPYEGPRRRNRDHPPEPPFDDPRGSYGRGGPGEFEEPRHRGPPDFDDRRRYDERPRDHFRDQRVDGPRPGRYEPNRDPGGYREPFRGGPRPDRIDRGRDANGPPYGGGGRDFGHDGPPPGGNPRGGRDGDTAFQRDFDRRGGRDRPRREPSPPRNRDWRGRR